MIFEDYVTSNKAAFLAKVQLIAAKLLTDPDYLMAVMYSESKLNPQAYNPNGGATGLIQFMPSTAAYLGTSTQELSGMSNVDQLDYVYKYFAPYTGRIFSFPDLYMVTFFPVALNKPADYVIHSDTLSADTIARANPIFDLDHNDQITVGEFQSAIYSRLPADIVAILKKKVKQ